MATYVTLDQMKAALPADITDRLLDDAGSGVGDPNSWSAIVTRVCGEIDGKIGQRYALPVTNVTGLQLLGQFAFVFAAELLYQRRGFFGEANPWTLRAGAIRGDPVHPLMKGELDRIASGDIPLYAAATQAAPSGAALTETSRIIPARPTGEGRGHMMS